LYLQKSAKKLTNAVQMFNLHSKPIIYTVISSPFIAKQLRSKAVFRAKDDRSSFLNLARKIGSKTVCMDNSPLKKCFNTEKKEKARSSRTNIFISC